MKLDCDDTTHLCQKRLRAQFSLRGPGMIMLVSPPDTSGYSRGLSVSPEYLFLILEAVHFRSLKGLRGRALSRARKMKASNFKLLANWLHTCAGSSGRVH